MINNYIFLYEDGEYGYKVFHGFIRADNPAIAAKKFLLNGYEGEEIHPWAGWVLQCDDNNNILERYHYAVNVEERKILIYTCQLRFDAEGCPYPLPWDIKELIYQKDF